MARISLSNGTWFETTNATAYEEATRWNGNNHISIATGSQYEHEMLYRTTKGTWVLHTWSQWQGSTPSYEVVDESLAHAWLITNGHGDSVPANVLAANEI